MDQCKVGLIENMIEVMIVVVYLGWGKLTLVYDILGGQ
jgi:hypothetical protein